MNIRHLVFIYLLISSSVIAQNNFNLGVEYLKKGEFEKADTCLTDYVREYPQDKNGLYNLSVVKLFLGDTCSFCNGLLKINYPWDHDKEALKQYFNICGYTDTIYYNKKNEIVSASKYKYFEVIEHHNCLDYVIGKYHLKRAKVTISEFNLNMNIFNSFKTDIYGVYQIIDDTNKFFTFGTSSPSFPSNHGTLQEVLRQTPAYSKAKKELNLSGYRVRYKVIVKKNGKIGSIEIMSTTPKMENKDILVGYLSQMFNYIPNFTPAKYNGEYVNFKIMEYLYFK